MTPKHLFIGAVLALPLAALPLAASAQYARSATWVNLRAGPGQEFPLVATYGPSTALTLQACTAGYGWCDVIGPDLSRGWIYAGNINYAYEQGYVPLPYYGVQIGIPIVTFAVGAYWGAHYANRPFYSSYPRYQYYRPPPPPVYRPPPGYPPQYRPPPGYHPPPAYRPPPGYRPPPAYRPPPPGARPPGIDPVPPPNARPPGGPPAPPIARPPSGNPPPPQGRPPGGNGAGTRPPGGGGGGDPQPSAGGPRHDRPDNAPQAR